MAIRQYIGARYVPIIYSGANGSPEWVSGVAYEPLTIVTYLNNSFTSRIPVPSSVGNPADNPDYWAVTGNYNAQVEAYRQQVNELSEQLSGFEENMEDYKQQVNEFSEHLSGFEENILFKSVESFGAVGDGVSDDTSAFTDAFNYAKANNCTIYTGSKKYLITSNLTLNNIRLNLNGGTILSNNNTISITECEIYNGVFERTSIIITTGRAKIHDLKFANWNGTAITVNNGSFEITCNSIVFENNSNSDTVGINALSSDCFFEHIYGYGCHTGIINAGANNYFCDIHLWLNSNNNFSGSIMFNNSATMVSLIGVCCDSYETFLNSSSNYLLTNLTNCNWINNNTLFSGRSFTVFSGDNKFLYGDLSLRLTGVSSSSNTVNLGNSYSVNIKLIDGNPSEGYTGYNNNEVINRATPKITSDGNSYIKVMNGIMYISISFWVSESTKTITFDLTNIINYGNFSGRGTAIIFDSSETSKATTALLNNGTLTITDSNNFLNGFVNMTLAAK